MILVLRILPSLFFTSFLPWYFLEQPKRILAQYVAYSNACNEILSITFLLRTYFSPWKSIIDEYPSNLMDYMAIAETFTLNCTTRIVGMIFRTVALAIALTVQIVLLIGYLTYFTLWLMYPGVVVAAIVFTLPLQ